MGAHARPKKSRNTGLMMTTAAVVGMATPVAASGVAGAAPGTHSAVSPAGSPAAPSSAGPELHTEHAFLADAHSGKSLWSGSAGQTSVAMGSITKVMTAEVVARHHAADLDKLVTIKPSYRDYVQQNGASTADLKAGDQLTVRQLLHGMLVPSGCDAAYALADTLGQGDTTQQRVASFVGQMNRDAQQLGMASTHFDTPSGISLDNGNRSSAADLAKLGAAVLQDETVAEIVRQPSTRQVATNGRVYTWENTDKLLTRYKGALGIKTGSGPDDGYCFLFAAHRDGRTLVGAVLQDTEARFHDAGSLLDWGFQHAR